MERECRYRNSQESVRVECGVWASAASKVWGKVWGFGWIWERRRRCVGPSKVNILWRYSWWKTLIRYRYQYTLTRIYVLKITVLPCLIWFTFCNGQIWNSTFHNTNLSKITNHYFHFITMAKNRKHRICRPPSSTVSSASHQRQDPYRPWCGHCFPWLSPAAALRASLPPRPMGRAHLQTSSTTGSLPPLPPAPPILLPPTDID